jgi:hypothetical protein
MRHGFLLAALVWVVAIALSIVPPGSDATQFYEHRWPTPYSATDYASGTGFYYTPPVALLFAVLTRFGLPIFAGIMSGAGLLSLYYLLGKWAWVGLLFPPVWWDISAGNINTLLGAVAVAGGASWSVAFLTKVSPGIGWAWHALRREWRPARRGIGVTLLACAVSLLIAPNLWMEWLDSLLANSLGYAGPGYFAVPIPLVPRLAAASAVVALGAIRGWRWVTPIAVTLAMPVLWWSALAPLVAIFSPRLRGPVRGEPVPGSDRRA